MVEEKFPENDGHIKFTETDIADYEDVPEPYDFIERAAESIQEALYNFPRRKTGPAPGGEEGEIAILSEREAPEFDIDYLEDAYTGLLIMKKNYERGKEVQGGVASVVVPDYLSTAIDAVDRAIEEFGPEETFSWEEKKGRLPKGSKKGLEEARKFLKNVRSPIRLDLRDKGFETDTNYNSELWFWHDIGGAVPATTEFEESCVDTLTDVRDAREYGTESDYDKVFSIDWKNVRGLREIAKRKSSGIIESDGYEGFREYVDQIYNQAADSIQEALEEFKEESNTGDAWILELDRSVNKRIDEEEFREEDNIAEEMASDLIRGLETSPGVEGSEVIREVVRK